MIRLADNTKDTLWAAEKSPIIGSRIHTLFSVYGNDFDFLKTWLCYDKSNNISGIMSYQGRTANLVMDDNMDMEELGAFLLNSSFDSLEVNLPQGNIIDKKLGGSGIPIKSMVLTTTPNPQLPKGITISVGTPKEVYKLICDSFEGFEENNLYPNWLYDTHRRVLSGNAAIYLLCKDGFPVATAGYYFSSPKYATISSVATDEKHRGRGYGRILVEYISKELINKGKTPYIIAASDGLMDYYGKMGFVPIDTGITFSKEGNN